MINWLVNKNSANFNSIFCLLDSGQDTTWPPQMI